MPIQRININDYSKHLGESRSEHEKFQMTLPGIISGALIDADFEKLDVYNIQGQKHKHNAGDKPRRAVVFFNGTAEGAGTGMRLTEALPINGIANDFKDFLAPKGDGIVIVSPEGTPLAEWRESTWELNILFNLCRKYDQASLDIFKYIMVEFNKLVWFPKTMENSWKHSQSKTQLVSRFTQTMKQQKEKQLKDDKANLERYENEIQNYKRSIKQLADKTFMLRKTIVIASENINQISEALVKDMDLILALPKVKDLHVKDGKIIIYTHPIIIHSDKGKHYYGGNYRIELNPENCDIRFFGDNPRAGYWTGQDPHPHVNGSNGRGCLGNIESTVAELCSQMQIYALATIGIDYLESANTDDGAGRKVVNWDEVNEDGSPLTKEQKEASMPFHCSRCGKGVETTDDLYLVFREVEEVDDDEYEPRDDHEVCEECRQDHYTYDERVDEYIEN